LGVCATEGEHGYAMASAMRRANRKDLRQLKEILERG
jgi:hypothetical protein